MPPIVFCLNQNVSDIVSSLLLRSLLQLRITMLQKIKTVKMPLLSLQLMDFQVSYSSFFPGVGNSCADSSLPVRIIFLGSYP